MAAATSIHTRYLEKDEYERWDRFVDESAFGTVFHKTFWLKTFAEWQHLRFSVAACFKGEELVGGMAVTWKRKFTCIPVIQMPVKTPFFSPVLAVSNSKYRFKQEHHQHTVANALTGFLMSGYKYICASFPPSYSDIRPYIWKGFKADVHYTYSTELHHHTDLVGSFDNAVRYRIKRASELNYDVKINGSRELIIHSWELEQKSFSRQAFDMIYAAKEEFATFIESMIKQESARLYTILYNNIPVASRIIILDPSKAMAYDWLAGADKDYLSTGLNQLLMLKILEDLQQSEYNGFDFAGAGIESIARYKSSYNFPLVPIYSVSRSTGLARLGMALKKLM